MAAVGELFAQLAAMPEDVADQRLAAHLAALASDEQRRDHLLAAAGQLWAGRPVLSAPRRLALITAHAGLLQVPGADVERFATCAGRYLAQVGLFDEAVRQFEQLDQRGIREPYLVAVRRTLHIDCLLLGERLAEAQALCERWSGVDLPGAERVTLDRQAAQVQIHLGRLDIAGRLLQRAEAVMAELAAQPQFPVKELARLDFELFQQRADLMLARERFEGLRAFCADFLLRREREGRALDGAARVAVMVRDAVALVQQNRSDPSRVDEAVTAIERLLQDPLLDVRHATQLRHSLCMLALFHERFDLARAVLAETSSAPGRRSLWMRAPLAAQLGRRTGAPIEELREHRRTLRRVLDEMLAEWRSVPCDNDGTGFLLLGNRMQVVAELVALEYRLDGAEAALQPLLEVQSCTSLSRRRGVGVSSVAALRAELFDERQGALLFVPAFSGSCVFAIDRNGVVRAELEPADQLREAARTLRRELASLDGVNDPAAREVATARLAAQRLARMLLPQEVFDRLRGWQHVLVGGGTLLGGLPAECLLLDDGRWFGEAFAVTHNDSMPLAAALRAGARAADDPRLPSVACFATLEPGGEFVRRNAVAGDLSLARFDEVLGRLPPETSVYMGEAASPKRFHDASGADLTVILAHGQSLGADHAPALGLSPDAENLDGELSSRHVLATSQSGVVVLSACYAARGPLRRGDDDITASMVGAVLAAGATAVVGSDAPLGLALHVDLDRALVEELLAGVPVAEALRRARVATAGGDDLRSMRVGQISVFGSGSAVVGVFTRPDGLLTPALIGALATLLLVSSVAVARRGYRRSATRPIEAGEGAVRVR